MELSTDASNSESSFDVSSSGDISWIEFIGSILFIVDLFLLLHRRCRITPVKCLLLRLCLTNRFVAMVTGYILE